ncbi:MAG: zinc ABC transporter substrate-binding protein [Clostridia bacterium]|nr:zinc ABC transporter substrate-binding protein [Clostridia bacterium]
MTKRYFTKLCLLLLMVAMLPLQVFAVEAPITIVTTNFPSFDLARSVAGDTANISMLLPPGAESHSYEPTPQDIITIQNADLFIYTGSESDHWIDGILSSFGENSPRTFSLMAHVRLLEEDLSASMEHAHDHAHDENCDHDPEHEAVEMDEHVWTSPVNVILLAEKLSAALQEICPESTSVYVQRLDNYLNELNELDAAFRSIVANSERKLLIFGDRFPMRYFANEYGLQYDAAFPGCSEDSEPSVRTVISLIDTVRAQQIPVICHIEFSSRRTADILAEETGAVPMLFHSCHNVSAEEIEAGATYLSLMWNNVEVLKEALN